MMIDTGNQLTNTRKSSPQKIPNVLYSAPCGCVYCIYGFLVKSAMPWVFCFHVLLSNIPKGRRHALIIHKVAVWVVLEGEVVKGMILVISMVPE